MIAKNEKVVWLIQNASDFYRTYHIEQKGFGLILYIEDFTDDCLQTARLIQAAPELLAACERAKEEIEILTDTQPGGFNEKLGACYTGWLNKVISKAKGG